MEIISGNIRSLTNIGPVIKIVHRTLDGDQTRYINMKLFSMCLVSTKNHDISIYNDVLKSIVIRFGDDIDNDLFRSYVTTFETAITFFM